MDALHREQRKEREETENKIKGLVNEVKLYAVFCYCSVSIYTGFEQLFPCFEIMADLSFALTLSKCRKKNREQMNERMEPNNEEKKEGKKD